MKTTSQKTTAPAEKPALASAKELALGIDQILASQDEILKRLKKIECYLAGDGDSCSVKKTK